MASGMKDTVLYPMPVQRDASGQQKHRWGFVNLDGELVIEPTFSWAGPFCDGLARVACGGGGWGFLSADAVEDATWGFINVKGKLVIGARHDEAGDFSEGLARVLTGAEFLWVPKDGEIKQGGKWGYLDTTGDTVIKPRFGAARDFADGLAVVRRQHLPGFGFINRKGKYAIKPNHESVGSFSDGVAPVKIDGKWGYMDKSENVVLPAIYQWATTFSEGLALVSRRLTRGERLRYIDRNGRIAIKVNTKLQWPALFSDGMAAVNLRGKWGYINSRGTMKIKPRFLEAEPFRHGIALVRDADGARYIDKHGKVVIAPVTVENAS